MASKLPRITDRGFGVQKLLNVPRHSADQGDLEEDQWLVGHTGVKEREVPPVVIETVLEVVPVLHRMNRLVGHELLEESP